MVSENPDVNKPKYIPTQEEINLAETLMTDEQARQSKSHEKGANRLADEEAEQEGYEVAKARAKAQKEKSSGDKDLKIKETINGLDIIVDWDSSKESYAITFPKLKDDPVAYGKNIHSPSITLKGLQKGEATKVFNYAIEQAETTADIYELYGKTSIFADDLIRKAN